MNSRPADAETLVEEASSGPQEKSTAQAIIQHLRTYGANARVCVIGPSEDALEYLRMGPEGLLDMYKRELSSVKPSEQITHIYGGSIRFYEIPKDHKQLHGPQWSMLVIENIPDVKDKAVRNAMLGLRLKPTMLIISTNGVYTALEREGQ